MCFLQRKIICSLCFLQTVTNFTSDLWEHSGVMQSCPVTSITIMRGSCLAQNRSLRFKSAVEMFPSPRVSRSEKAVGSAAGLEVVPLSAGRNLPPAGPAGCVRSACLCVFLAERAPGQCSGHVCMGGCSGWEKGVPFQTTSIYSQSSLSLFRIMHP